MIIVQTCEKTISTANRGQYFRNIPILLLPFITYTQNDEKPVYFPFVIVFVVLRIYRIFVAPCVHLIKYLYMYILARMEEKGLQQSDDEERPLCATKNLRNEDEQYFSNFTAR